MGRLVGGWGVGVCVRVGGRVLIAPSHAVLGPEVRLKGPHGQLCSALWIPPQPIPISLTLPLHLACVRLYQHASIGVARLENHAHYLD